MNFSRKTLAAVGFVVLAAVGATPAVASATTSTATPQMYQSCSASQVGTRLASDSGSTLECVGTSTGTGYNWASPGRVD